MGHDILLAAHLQVPFALNPESYHFPVAKLNTTGAPLLFSYLVLLLPSLKSKCRRGKLFMRQGVGHSACL